MELRRLSRLGGIVLIALVATSALAKDELVCHVSFAATVRLENDGKVCVSSSDTAIGGGPAATLGDNVLKVRYDRAETDLTREQAEMAVPIRIHLPADVDSLLLEISPINQPNRKIAMRMRAAIARGLTTLVLSRGDKYRASFTCTHYTPTVRVLSLQNAAIPTVTVDFNRLRVLSGTVADIATLRPVRGAEIRTKERDGAITDEKGSFTVEVSHGWPDSLSIAAPGYCSMVVPIPRGAGDHPLSPIWLGHGGDLDVEIQHDGALSIQLLKRDDRDRLLPEISAQLSRRETRFVHRQLAPGTYLLHVSGTRPLEQFNTDVHVTEGTTAYKTLLIESRDVRLSVLRQGQPVGGTTVNVVHSTGWQSKLTIPSSGYVDEPLWQGGDFTAMVMPSGGGAIRTSTNLDDEPLIWTIVLPDRHLSVAVRDAETGTPISDAVVVAERTAPDHSISSKGVNTAGLATFEVLPSGHFRVGVAARGYVHSSLDLDLPDEDQDRSIEIDLRKAVSLQVQVIDQTGAPIPQAVVMTSVDLYRRTTDENGFCSLDVPADGSLLFVVPQQASFAVTTLNAVGAHDSLPVIVPSGTCSVGVRVVDTDGNPVAHVPLSIVFNGFVFPQPVADSIAAQQRHHFETDASGMFRLSGAPAGSYQFIVRSSAAASASVALVVEAGSSNFAEVRLSATKPPS